MIEVYADGAYDPVLRRGGWAAVLVDSGEKRVFSGASQDASSPRMEVTAVLEGISRTPPGAEVNVFTDSQYVFGCMSRGWKRRANLDLWQQMDSAVAGRKVKCEWIDQTAENPLHREAHNLATSLTKDRVTVPPARDDKKPAETPRPATPEKTETGAALTHIDTEGRPQMVDISGKADTEREAVAKCLVRMSPATFGLLQKGDLPKGDVISVARLAGIMAAKQTPHLIPLCHPILIGDVDVDFALDGTSSTIEITTRVKSLGKTGVEMEALTAATVAALTIYDMCKAVEKGIRIENVRLVRKTGGKSGPVTLE